MITIQAYLGISQMALSLELLEKIFQLDQNDFPFPWTKAQWLDCLANSKDYLIVTSCDEGGDVISFALFHLSHEEGLGHLLKVCTRGNKRNEGHGCELLKMAINDLLRHNYRSIYLEVALNNDSALKLYESLGFSKLALKKRFYSNGEDAWAMQRIH